MAILALILSITWLAVVIGLRGYIAYRQTGKLVRPSRSAVGTPAWWAKAASSMGLLLLFAAQIAELAGVEPISLLDHWAVRWAGAGLVVAGILATLGAQLTMGASWRGDVDPNARTALVTHGPFRLVRNPILVCTAATAIGLALMVPNWLAVLMLVAFVVGIQIQVRLVEEPYLERVHGDAYRTYAARTGRFLPGIGRRRTRA